MPLVGCDARREPRKEREAAAMSFLWLFVQSTRSIFESHENVPETSRGLKVVAESQMLA